MEGRGRYGISTKNGIESKNEFFARWCQREKNIDKQEVLQL